MKTKLDDRQHATELLRRTGAAFRWHPTIVDLAIDAGNGKTSLQEIILDDGFQAACRTRLELSPALARALDGNPARILDADIDTLTPFYFSILRRACGGFARPWDNRKLWPISNQERHADFSTLLRSAEIGRD